MQTAHIKNVRNVVSPYKFRGQHGINIAPLKFVGQCWEALKLSGGLWHTGQEYTGCRAQWSYFAMAYP